ncbi:hypothetical protein Tco_0492217 [Tanacetum coccineum]
MVLMPTSELEQILEDKIWKHGQKWQLLFAKWRANKYYQKTDKNIFIKVIDIAGYDKSKSEMAEEQVQLNMALCIFRLRDTECLVLSLNFKLPEENKILLKVPRKDNMYSFDMKNIDEDGLNNENAEQERFSVDSSSKDVNVVGQQVNTASLDVNTGSLELNVVGPSVSTASPNEEDSTEEEPKVNLGNITNSYIIQPLPNTKYIGSSIDNVYCRKNFCNSNFTVFDIVISLMERSHWNKMVLQKKKKIERGIMIRIKQIACARFQVTPKTSHLLGVKMIFRYLKGKPTLGLWYSRDSLFELVAYTDSRATLDRKSTTAGCISQEVGTPRYLSLVVPLTKVSDEAIHKELGDRMERAATTASSLEAEQDSGSGPSAKVPSWKDFELNAAKLKVNTVRLKLVLSVLLSAVKHMLMLPVQVSAVEALVNKKRVIVTESSIRRDLHLNDAEGTDCLPTATIFEELARMGYEKPS